jgi:serine/threonine protein kinase
VELRRPYAFEVVVELETFSLAVQYKLEGASFIGLQPLPADVDALDVFPILRPPEYVFGASNFPTTSTTSSTAVASTSVAAASTSVAAAPTPPASASKAEASEALVPAVVGATVAITCLLVLFVIIRRRHSRSLDQKQEELEMELGQAANSRARAQFGREYGHALRNAEAFELELMDLALSRHVIRLDVRIAEGLGGEVWHGHIARQAAPNEGLVTHNHSFYGAAATSRVGAEGPSSTGSGRRRALCDAESVTVHRLTASDAAAQADFLVQMRLHYLLGRHPNVQRLLGMVSLGAPLLIVLEPTPQGQIGTYLQQRLVQEGGLATRDLMIILRQVASAMAHLESLSIVHRGLGLESIFVAGGPANVKLAGFAAARDVYSRDVYIASSSFAQGPATQAAQRAGTQVTAHPLRYLSPECLDDGFYTSKSDMWAYGVLMGEVLSHGEPLFQGQPVEAIAQAIRACRLPELHVDAPALAETLRQASLQRQSQARPSFADMYAQLASAPCDANDDAWGLVQTLEVGKALSSSVLPSLQQPLREVAPQRRQSVSRTRFLANLNAHALQLGPTVVSGGGSGPCAVWTARVMHSDNSALPPALWVQTVRSNQPIALRAQWSALAELLLRLPHAHLLPAIGTVHLPPAKMSTVTASGGQGGLAPAGGLALLHRVAYGWHAWAALHPSLPTGRRRAMLTVPVLMALEHLCARRVYTQAVSLQHIFVQQGRVRLGGLPLVRDIFGGEGVVIAAIEAYLAELRASSADLRTDMGVTRLQEACSKAAAAFHASAPDSVAEEFENDHEAGCCAREGSITALPLSQLVLLAQDLCGDGARWELSWDALTFVRHLGEGNFGEVSLMALDGRIASPNAGALPASGVGDDTTELLSADHAVEPLAGSSDGHGKSKPSRHGRKAVAPLKRNSKGPRASASPQGPQGADIHTLVAAKMLLDDSHQADFQSEVQLMMRVRHPNLVALLHVVTAELPRALIMEYLPGGALDGWLMGPQGKDALSEDLLFILHQVASGMSELSRLGIGERR